MQSNFNLPSVDHLVEGIHYTKIEWDFAEGCAPGEKMTFGVCRKVGTSQKAASEEELAGKAAQKQKSTAENNKAVTAGGKKYGWAMKDGKPIMVQWGSVAGENKVGPKTPAISESPSPKRVAPTPASQTAAAALVNPNATLTSRQQAINEIGRRAFEN